MHISSAGLLAYKRDVYSQTGEDGIIAKIIEMLPCKDKWCVEFGAADGVLFSNTTNLIENEKYSSILIECDKKNSMTCKKRYSKYANVITLNKSESERAYT